jgi:hypothetical protein
MLHHLGARLTAGMVGIDADDQILGSAKLLQDGTDAVDNEHGGVLALAGGGEDDRVAALQGPQRLHDGGGLTVGQGENSTDDAHGLDKGYGVVLGVGIDHADGLDALHVAIDTHRLVADVVELVLNDTQTGLIDQHLSGGAAEVLVQAGIGDGLDQLVAASLIVLILRDLLGARARSTRPFM